MTRRWLLPILALALALAAGSRPAAACSKISVRGASLSFGTYNPRDPHPSTTSARIEVECQGGSSVEATYELQLATGASGRYDHRVMTAGREELVYNLFTDSTLRSIWGDGAGSSFTLRGRFAPSRRGKVVDDHLFYGLIPPLQEVRSGAYSDALVVTVSF